MASLPYPLNQQYYHVRVGMAGMPYPPTDCRSYIKTKKENPAKHTIHFLIGRTGILEDCAKTKPLSYKAKPLSLQGKATAQPTFLWNRMESRFLRDPFGIRSGCCILCLKNMLIDKNKGYSHAINMITEYFLR